MATTSPAVRLVGLWVDTRGQDILHRKPTGRAAAQLVDRGAVDADLLGWQREPQRHGVQQLAVPLPPRVDDHGVRGVVQGL